MKAMNDAAAVDVKLTTCAPLQQHTHTPTYGRVYECTVGICARLNATHVATAKNDSDPANTYQDSA